jgi:hypothetical protein
MTRIGTTIIDEDGSVQQPAYIQQQCSIATQTQSPSFHLAICLARIMSAGHNRYSMPFSPNGQTCRREKKLRMKSEAFPGIEPD